MMRRKLLHRMKEVCGATSRMMKDESMVGEHQVDGTWLLIYIYIYSILHILTIVFPGTRTVEYQPIFHGVT